MPLPSARLYIPEDIYHEMKDKRYLNTYAIHNILRIGITEYDRQVAEGMAPDDPSYALNISDDLYAKLESKGYLEPDIFNEIIRRGVKKFLEEREGHSSRSSPLSV